MKSEHHLQEGHSPNREIQVPGQATQESSTQQRPTQGAPGHADLLAQRLLPVLMHRMNNATQLLSNLRAMGECTQEASFLRTHARDLGRCSEDIQKVGYLLAVVASANGADLLLARREARGVESMVDAVIDTVRRDGGQMNAPARDLPDLCPSVHNGWELPWAFGTLLYASTLGHDVTEGTFPSYDWQLLQEAETWVLVSSHVPSDQFASLRGQIEALMPETQLDVCAEGWSWRVPAAWLKSS